jgi:Ser/Thr protein kinase RdoA (MazF antagonist)
MTITDQCPDLHEIIAQFDIPGQFEEVVLIESGHINDTYASRFTSHSGSARYVHQRINTQVFRQPEQLMANIERVTSFARKAIAAARGDPLRETLNLVPSRSGGSFYRTPGGAYWRTYLFIDGARTYDTVENPAHLRNAAAAFGNFQKLLSRLPGPPLYETIPDFHNTPKRYQAFLTAVANDAAGRAAGVQPEIDFMLAHADQTSVIVDLLAGGILPLRVTHNDTKLNNVLIDDRTGEGLCVIDLDTVMPGSALYDFGDAVRAGATTAAEDEPDLGRVNFDLALFDCLAAGYVTAARDFLAPAELEHLAFGGILITLEQALRFLADYLNGDVYYKVHRPGHNLDRCRTQIKLIDDMERQIDQMQAIIAQYAAA